MGVNHMEAYREIEKMVADKYHQSLTAKKAIGDFMLDDNHAVNVKSNNIHKENYSPNMISIKRLHEWVFEKGNELSFIFVNYEEKNGELKILEESKLIPIQQISWDCLSIEAQGYGVIQKIGELKVIESQTKKDFHRGFIAAYGKYLAKEQKKHEQFSKKLKSWENENPGTI